MRAFQNEIINIAASFKASFRRSIIVSEVDGLRKPIAGKEKQKVPPGISSLPEG
jgi:hypothetical protein